MDLATQFGLQGADHIPTNLLYIVRTCGAPMVNPCQLLDDVLRLCREGSRKSFTSALDLAKTYRAGDPLMATIAETLVHAYELDEVVQINLRQLTLAVVGDLDRAFEPRQVINVVNGLVGFDGARRTRLTAQPTVITGGLLNSEGCTKVLRTIAHALDSSIDVASAISQLQRAGIGSFLLLNAPTRR